MSTPSILNHRYKDPNGNKPLIRLFGLSLFSHVVFLFLSSLLFSVLFNIIYNCYFILLLILFTNLFIIMYVFFICFLIIVIIIICCQFHLPVYFLHSVTIIPIYPYICYDFVMYHFISCVMLHKI